MEERERGGGRKGERRWKKGREEVEERERGGGRKGERRWKKGREESKINTTGMNVTNTRESD